MIYPDLRADLLARAETLVDSKITYAASRPVAWPDLTLAGMRGEASFWRDCSAWTTNPKRRLETHFSMLTS